MAYSALTFTASEVPTLTKWNQLWANDASFNDGTGIGAGVITNAKLAAAAVTSSKVDFTTSGGIWWQELGRYTAVGTVTTMTVNPIAAKKYLKILYIGLPNGNTSEYLRFNNDSGNNYTRNTSDDGGAAASIVSSPGMQYGGSALVRNGRMEIFNLAAQEKGYFGQTIYNTAAGAANQVVRTEVAGKWSNTGAQITRIDLVAISGGFLAGSEIIILGHD